MKSIKNILIAEDDGDDYLFLLEALQQINPGFVVNNVANGVQLIRYLQSQPPPDLIFLDLNMPLKNGIATLQTIKEDNQFSHIPVIIYSTSRYLKSIDDCYKNDAHYYLVKPAVPHALFDHLQTVFNRLQENSAKPGVGDFVVGLETSIERIAQLKTN